MSFDGDGLSEPGALLTPSAQTHEGVMERCIYKMNDPFIP